MDFNLSRDFCLFKRSLATQTNQSSCGRQENYLKQVCTAERLGPPGGLFLSYLYFSKQLPPPCHFENSRFFFYNFHNFVKFLWPKQVYANADGCEWIQGQHTMSLVWAVFFPNQNISHGVQDSSYVLKIQSPQSEPQKLQEGSDVNTRGQNSDFTHPGMAKRGYQICF